MPACAQYTRGRPRVRIVRFAFLMVLVLLPAAGWGTTLQSIYAAAHSQATYDKYLVLDAGAVYTGGLVVNPGTSTCIRGNGATLDLQNATIHVEGFQTQLDIDHCVILYGGDLSRLYGEGALDFVDGGGNVVNNTICASTVGVRVYGSEPGSVVVTNNIIVRSSLYGVLCQLYHDAAVSYNDCWGNAQGNYVHDCG